MKISEKLISNNLISGDKVCAVFDSLYQGILSIPITSGSSFMSSLWERYGNESQNLNGKVFEGLIASVLYRLNILPIYVQAKLAFVPNVDFDFILYFKEYGPIVLSAKTSLRERYKQADLEGMMLREVHRNAKTYLITLNDSEAKNVNTKIENGQVLGIDSVITTTKPNFDKLLEDLSSLTFYKPKKVEIISDHRIIEPME
jgi:hypothetical protein